MYDGVEEIPQDVLEDVPIDLVEDIPSSDILLNDFPDFI